MQNRVKRPRSRTVYDPNPTFKFRGVWIPGDLFDMVRSNQITASEIFLLNVIDGLVQCRGEGCWASNAYLGSFLNLKERQIRRMISSLASRNLLVINNVKKSDGSLQRYLEAAWSRLQNERVPPGHGRPGGRSEMTANLKKKKEERPATPDLASKGGKAMLVEDDEDTLPRGVSKFDLSCSKTLHETITKITRRFFQWNQKTWANQFKILRRELEEDEDRIERVLQFWIDEAPHLGRLKLPSLCNAQNFRKCFTWIEDKMTKHGPSQVKHTKEGKIIVDRLLRLVWPKGSDAQLADAVEISLSNYRAFFAKAKTLCRETEQLNGSGSLFMHLWSKWLREPEAHIEQWFVHTWKSVKNWREWSGDLMTTVFTHDHKKFIAAGLQVTTEYGSDAKAFRKVYNKIMEMKP